MTKLADKIEAFHNEIAEIPQIKRGQVWCHQCGNTQRAGAECFKTGWPKCCGYTMSIDSPDERAALRAREASK